MSLQTLQMDRPKRPPPLPKFEEKKDETKKDDKLEEKLNSFMNSLQGETPKPPDPKVDGRAQAKAQAKEEGKAEKKKFTLASINSKLNNMLSAKKININTALTSEADKHERKEEQPKKPIEIEYDPQQPNNYELAKHIYTPQYAALAQDYAEHTQTPPQEQPVLEQQEEEPVVEWQAEEKEQIALRMMQKFGYKVGEGLGKTGQGIKTPLIVRKTTDSSGVIEQSNIPLSYLISPEVSARNALAANGVEATEVLVLVGLVSLAEVEGAEDEIRSECSLHGVIKDWVMYLLDELRIFVEYQTREQALNAFVKLNGKYFGQKLVSLRFYDPTLFRNNSLDAPLHPHIAN